MSVNFSVNSSLHYPDISLSSSLLFYIHCLKSKPSCFIYIALNTIQILVLLPPCIFILHHGLQQRKQKRLISTAITHTDCFTYHVAVMELIDTIAFFLCLTGIYSDNSTVLYMGIFLLFFVQNGILLFHSLTCVERYLAVVHPITYLRLKNKRGIRIRTVITGCVWLLCFVGMGLVMEDISVISFNFCILLISLTAVCFCSVAVLCVLFHPGPGKHGKNMEWIDPSKMRAFLTILALLIVLLLRFVWDIIWLELYFKSQSSDCIIIMFYFLFAVPSHLVLPLLYLHRAGKYVCCKQPCLVKK